MFRKYAKYLEGTQWKIVDCILSKNIQSLTLWQGPHPLSPSLLFSHDRDKQGRGIFYVMLRHLTPKFYDEYE